MKSNFRRALIGLAALLYVGSSSGQEIPTTPSIASLPNTQTTEKTEPLKVAWKKTYEPIGALKKGFVVADPFKVSDGFIIGLYVYGEQETFLAGELLKVGFDGNVVWQHPVPYQDINYLIEYKNGYIFTGTESNDSPKPPRSIVSLDEQGKVLRTTKLQDERFYDAFPVEVKESLLTYVTPPKYCMKNICRGTKGALSIKDGTVSIVEPMRTFIEVSVPSFIKEVDPYRSHFLLNHVSNGWLAVVDVADEKNHKKEHLLHIRKFNEDGSPQWQYKLAGKSFGIQVNETNQGYVIIRHLLVPDKRALITSGKASQTMLLLFSKAGSLMKMRKYAAPSYIRDLVRTNEGFVVVIDRAVVGANETPNLAMLGPAGDIIWEQQISIPVGNETGVRSIHGVDKSIFLFGNLADKFVITKLDGLE